MVDTVGMKVSELAFILYFDFSYPRSRSSIACIGTSNLIYHHTAVYSGCQPPFLEKETYFSWFCINTDNNSIGVWKVDINNLA